VVAYNSLLDRLIQQLHWKYGINLLSKKQIMLPVQPHKSNSYGLTSKPNHLSISNLLRIYGGNTENHGPVYTYSRVIIVFLLFFYNNRGPFQA